MNFNYMTEVGKEHFDQTLALKRLRFVGFGPLGAAPNLCYAPIDFHISCVLLSTGL